MGGFAFFIGGGKKGEPCLMERGSKTGGQKNGLGGKRFEEKERYKEVTLRTFQGGKHMFQVGASGKGVNDYKRGGKGGVCDVTDVLSRAAGEEKKKKMVAA